MTHGSQQRRAQDDADPMLLKHNSFSKIDREILKDMHQVLETFQQLKLCSQRWDINGKRGILCKYFLSIFLLTESLKEEKRYYDTSSLSFKHSTRKSHHLSTCLGNAWLKLTEYFQKMGDSPVYIASYILKPMMKWKFFEKR